MAGLLELFDTLMDDGATFLVIEHNLDVMATATYGAGWADHDGLDPSPSEGSRPSSRGRRNRTASRGQLIPHQWRSGGPVDPAGWLSPPGHRQLA
jgi:hypothetical protein